MDAAPEARREPGDRASLETLSRVASNLAIDTRLEPLLELVLGSAVALLGCESGSLSLVSPENTGYRKVVDLAAGCQAGREFPLSEGVTGIVVRTRRAVTFRHYADVPGGHLAPGSELFDRAVVGAPVLTRSGVTGALVVFAADAQRLFTDEDVELLQRFATHAAIAMTNARLHAEAEAKAQTAAVLAERERAMLDLHDALGRGLATVLVRLRDAEQAVAAGGDVAEALRDARRSAEAVLADSQRAAWARVEVLDGQPLSEAMRLELEWTQAIAGAQTSFRIFGDPQPVEPEVAAQLLRIVQESLTNVAQHAAATQVRLGLVYLSDTVAVIVEDDGCGFDRSSGRPVGRGLAGLVARATQLGGVVQLDSTPGWGTRVRADLPYRASPDVLLGTPRQRLVIVHDQPAMRAGLVGLLSHREPGVQVVAEIGEAVAAVEAIALLAPDVVLLGSRVAREADIDLISALHSTDPDLPLIVYLDEPTNPMLEWVMPGVRGIVPREADATELGRAVVAAAQGDVLVFSGILRQLGDVPLGDPLTAREREVLALLREGLADKQIATRLSISVKTVEKHVGAVLRKNRARSRTELVARG
ncbi:hypothetical protein BW730_06835 [Tessaracoccus aquimaris]|uniref:HTH luxR-type domain-containing protein n=1 Tax=Tessaracoccus aquimaris TaxID=1332264 RepID=A0A1Q2CMA2_9ACTN|nr:response regulator transcription factor family protein [Tessaracoccus aquimaris]AQP47258.1 hypothetical protein BW730_06835 [Tessaracoccus aquimaris]